MANKRIPYVSFAQLDEEPAAVAAVAAPAAGGARTDKGPVRGEKEWIPWAADQ